jgi:hypothetical protein
MSPERRAMSADTCAAVFVKTPTEMLSSERLASSMVDFKMKRVAAGVVKVVTLGFGILTPLIFASCGENTPASTTGTGGHGTGGVLATGGVAGGKGGAGGGSGTGGGSSGGLAQTGGQTGGAGTITSGSGGTTGTGGAAMPTGGTTGGVSATGGGAGTNASGTGGAMGGAGGVSSPDGGLGSSGGGPGTGGAAGGCSAATDCPPGEVCDGNTHACGACPSDAACLAGYGPNHICVGGSCVTGNCHTAANCSNGAVCVGGSCTPCTNHATCQAQYGPGNVCISGGCTPGQCRSAADCLAGQVCNSSFTCVGCGSDADCVSGYEGNFVCVAGACVPGDCRTAADCLGGRICDTAASTCVICADDATCVASYGAGHLCVGGSCISGTCRSAADCPSGEVCDANTYACRACATDGECTGAYGAGHLCLGGACVTGVCRTSLDCTGGQLCDTSTHTCGPCASDTDCTAGYGANHLCVGNACVSGTCHNTADCGGGELCDPTTHVCGACASDADCTAGYGPQHLCVGNVCVAGSCRVSSDCGGGQICDGATYACHPCSGDAACSADPAYGGSTVCISGGCVPGDCHGSSADCPTGQLCGVAFADSCGGCTSDGQCAADPTYGPSNICYQGICQVGDCHGTSADCLGVEAGLICGAKAAETCGACASDAQCQADTSYGPATICNTTTGQPASGQCVSATCSASGACAANPGDFCCADLCVPGNCCVDADCAADPRFGAVYRCVNNSCTGCAPATGNVYLVDPIAGNDATATGSGLAGGSANASCSFRTVTRALAAAGSFAASGTRIVIVGVAGQTTSLDVSETLPILVPANVTITTRNGPILITLPPSADPNLASVAGFQLGGDRAALAPDPAAPLTLDGGGQTSGIGVGVAPGGGKSAAISYLTVQRTGGHAIAVTNGTLNIGAGVAATMAGTAGKRRDGLNVAGGTVNIAVGAGQAPTTFNGNSQHGIYVTGAGVVNILGFPITTPAPNGQGTVQANANAFAGLRIFESPGAAAGSRVDGLVAWQNAQNGLRLYGGGRVTVRNGVFLGNGLNGVFITSFDASAAGNDLSQVDLGKAGDPGRNQIQAANGANPNLAGLCLSMSSGVGALGLSAEGNVFAGPVDCAAASIGIARSSVCGGGVDLGIIPASGTSVTADVALCQ